MIQYSGVNGPLPLQVSSNRYASPYLINRLKSHLFKRKFENVFQRKLVELITKYGEAKRNEQLCLPLSYPYPSLILPSTLTLPFPQFTMLIWANLSFLTLALGEVLNETFSATLMGLEVTDNGLRNATTYYAP